MLLPPVRPGCTMWHSLMLLPPVKPGLTTWKSTSLPWVAMYTSLGAAGSDRQTLGPQGVRAQVSGAQQKWEPQSVFRLRQGLQSGGEGWGVGGEGGQWLDAWGRVWVSMRCRPALPAAAARVHTTPTSVHKGNAAFGGEIGSNAGGRWRAGLCRNFGAAWQACLGGVGGGGDGGGGLQLRGRHSCTGFELAVGQASACKGALTHEGGLCNCRHHTWAVGA